MLNKINASYKYLFLMTFFNFELPISGLCETYELSNLDNPISTKERKH